MTIALVETRAGLVVDRDGECRAVTLTLDDVFVADDPAGLVVEAFASGVAATTPLNDILAPIGSQEVWACGVTYRRSRDARMSEASRSTGAQLYDIVYDAERPEIFLKSTPHRVVGPGSGVRIRSDSTWDVPEPELTLAVSSAGRIFGFTIGNDMSSRSIEGDSALYIPQAKIYDGSAALGPRLIIGDPPPPNTVIALEISRGGATVFEGRTSLDRLKRSFEELVAYLIRDNSFPDGVLLMTGTGIVPPDDFTLEAGDVVTIEIDGVGSLQNHVVRP